MSIDSRIHPNKRMYYDANTKGRDFVVGDLHGCIKDLLDMLVLLNFDASVDRVFCVGDLVDRGPDSLKTAKLIYEPWFNTVKGNHEQLMIDTLINEDRNMSSCWFQNGGDWNFSHDQGELTALARDLKSLPLVICVGEGENRFNIVHAELTHRPIVNGHRSPVPVTDQMILKWVFDEHDEQEMIWGRTMVQLGQALNPDGARFHSKELSPTYVGHTPIGKSIQIEQMIYIDTGAVFHHYHKCTSDIHALTIAEPNKKVLHKFSIMHRTLETIPQAELLKYCQ
jgi:serine/threonine protein phosphatase 1